jgi:prepilin-type N-terminal cleavage/methylation domain-containing protein
MKWIRADSRRSARVPRCGFTLVEILATLTLVAIVLPSVMHGISLSLATADQARQQAEAAALAHSKLSEIVAAGQLQHAVLSGDFGTDWPDYRWEARLGDWDGATLRQLDVIVSWKHAGVDRSVTMTTLVYTGGSS